MTVDRQVSNWTDLSTSTGSSPNLVLPAPMVCDWKPTVTAREIRDGLFYEADLVLKFFHLFLSAIVLVTTVLIPTCPPWTTSASIILYLIYYMFVSSWNGGSSKTRHLWRAMIHPHSLVHCAYLVLGDADFARTCFSTYVFFHVFFLRFGFHPYIACFINDPLQLPRVRAGLCVIGITGSASWLLQQSSLLTTPIFMILTSFFIFVLAGIVGLIGQSINMSSRRTFNHLVYSPLTDFRIAFQSIIRFRSTVGMSISSFLRLLNAHIDLVKTWSDPPVSLDILIEWLAHERGVTVWQFLTQFKIYRLGKDPDPSDIVPQDILDAVEAGRRERWFSADTPLKSPLLRGH